MKQFGQWLWSCGVRQLWRCCVVCVLLCLCPVVWASQCVTPMLRRLKWCIFLGQWVRSPSRVGAVFPSSVFLAREIASAAQAFDRPGYVVELGAGLGAVTAQLLKSGIHPERLIAVERSSVMVRQLRQQFPHIRVIEGSAEHLSDHLGGLAGSIRQIVSSLPLRSLSESVRGSIFHEVQSLLREQGVFIQYTYAVSSRQAFYPDSFQCCFSRVVWRNVPPAKVECFSMMPSAVTPFPG